jgi:lipoprotein-anchoring transpeptidase ErfK/SrfK
MTVKAIGGGAKTISGTPARCAGSLQEQQTGLAGVDVFTASYTGPIQSPYRVADFTSAGSAQAPMLVDPSLQEPADESCNFFLRGAASLFLVTATLVPSLFAAAPAMAYEATPPPTSQTYVLGRVAQPEELSPLREDGPVVPSESPVRRLSTREQGDIHDQAARTGYEKSLLESPLRKGMKGEKVKKLQQGLNRFVKVKATGVFDDATEEAVKEFQRSNHLTDDGVVGNVTYGVLWTRSFWEKGVALDISGGDFYKTLPKNLKVRADLSEQRIHLIDTDSGKPVRSYPMSSGAPGYETPVGDFRITQIGEKPSWYPPPSPWARGAKVEPPGPNNPLGPVYMRLDGSTILLHGVPISKFDSLGSYPASHGCMRMFPQDAWELHKIVKNGTAVEVVR